MKDINGYKGLYAITIDGLIISLKKGCTLTPHISNSGYVNVKLYKNGKYEHRYIHRLVAEHFIPNPKNKDTVNHIDGNKLNNDINNLEWLTKSENTRHAYTNKLMVPHPQIGSKHGSSKLKEEDISQIKQLYDSGFSYSEIAKIFKVTKGTIWKVYNGLNWTHVNG